MQCKAHYALLYSYFVSPCRNSNPSTESPLNWDLLSSKVRPASENALSDDVLAAGTPRSPCATTDNLARNSHDLSSSPISFLNQWWIIFWLKISADLTIKSVPAVKWLFRIHTRGETAMVVSIPADYPRSPRFTRHLHNRAAL